MLKTMKRLQKEKLISPPKWLIDGTQYLVMMGSIAYGVSTDHSDVDVYGFTIPHKNVVFPHLAGYIDGFDMAPERFGTWEQHHINDASSGKEYDFAIHSIVKFFKLTMDNNPNMVDAIFVPRRCVLHSTQIGEHMRENRKLFLHKGGWHKFKGYSYKQLCKMRSKEPVPGSKRYDDIMKNGYDTKFAYHVVRLLNEIEQIMTVGDLDLEQNREQLKSIRRGEWYMDQVIQYAGDKEKDLESLYLTSELRYGPDREAVKQILVDCLEMHFGDISSVVYQESKSDAAIAQIKRILGC